MRGREPSNRENNQGSAPRRRGVPAEPRRAGDALQRPLRSRFQARLTPSVRRLKAQGKEGMSIVKAVSIQVFGTRQAAPARCRAERTRTFFSTETIHEDETPRDLVDRHRHVRPAGACYRPVAALS